MASKGKRLRSGFTTGACAAAAAKAASSLLFYDGREPPAELTVEIPFPGGERVRFRAISLHRDEGPEGPTASATVVKDGGDDPDVTHGAEIKALARVRPRTGAAWPLVSLLGGEGVGKVTKPGLSIPPGEPAITPVPRRMIADAVGEAAGLTELGADRGVEITISVPSGVMLARKTLNGRLGIVGGISILGTTGIVRPLSAEAWTSTIAAAMGVAVAAGIREIVLSTGRVSEKAHMKRYGLPEEAYVLMGDYVAFSLQCAAAHRFDKIHISAQWAKTIKIGMSVPETHVRHGALNPGKAAETLRRLGVPVPLDRRFNTAREIYDGLSVLPGFPFPMLSPVCRAVKRYGEEVTRGLPVIAHLVSYEGEITGDSEEGIYPGHRL